jgi:hypothetical protein
LKFPSSSSTALSFYNCLQLVTSFISKDEEETSVRWLELWLSSAQGGKATSGFSFSPEVQSEGNNFQVYCLGEVQLEPNVKIGENITDIIAVSFL